MLLIVVFVYLFHVVDSISRDGNSATLRKYGISCMVILLVANIYYILILLVLKDSIFRDANLACYRKNHILQMVLLQIVCKFHIVVVVVVL